MPPSWALNRKRQSTPHRWFGTRHAAQNFWSGCPAAGEPCRWRHIQQAMGLDSENKDSNRGNINHLPLATVHVAVIQGKHNRITSV